VEENGDSAKQRAIFPTPRIFTEVLLTLFGASGWKWRVCQAKGNIVLPSDIYRSFVNPCWCRWRKMESLLSSD
jgi:hypothetical protein